MEILTEQISKYKETGIQEVNDKRIILQLIKTYGANVLSRENETFHITVSGLVCNKYLNRMLLVHHNIYDTWSFIGGHADSNADLLNVLIGEVREEAGLNKVSPYCPGIQSIDILTTGHHMKNEKYVAPHLHLNISYFIIADEEEAILFKKDEVSNAKWVSAGDIFDYIEDKEMKFVTGKLLNKLQ